ncbi:putative reverse transcriptase zinc-binding domain-containing protein [Helianthus annuus]|uniref:Reverse transcriptase zinc-binding domain-containing protein n=1 Tax=Helianthus annuus TaxID=4232 RepID=A0A9K3EH04_HELAN|nr:putative reverse transcriptase zinc-binding domain-containing protein [Helianthus annuus]
MVWRLALNRLPTIENLARRNIHIPNLRCKICDESDETSSHLFVECYLAQKVWDFVVEWCKIRPFFILEIKDLVNIHNGYRGSAKWRRVIWSVIQVAIWVVWKTRNEVVFSHKKPNFERMKEEIKLLSFFWIKNRAKRVVLSWDDWCKFELINMGV